jgi:Tyrosine-protein kinase ephrin type A/B receptor-like/HYR domain
MKLRWMIAAAFAVAGLGLVSEATPVVAAAPCAAGTYGPSGMDPCTPASPGHFVPDAGADEQIECDAGRYQDLPGQTSCIDASQGFHVPAPGATEELPCLAPTYQDLVGSSSCKDAPAGSYVVDDEATEPTPCSPGTWQADTGQVSCDDVEPGFFTSISGASTQSPCPVGYFQDQPGQTLCIAAPAGHFVPDVEATESTPCAAGTWQAATGESACDPAAAGHYVPDSGADEQLQCDVGTHQDETGQTSCKLAPAGTFVDSLGAEDPTPCPAGTYQTATGSTSCIDAEAGTYVPEAGSAVPGTDCPVGRYQDQTGQSSCELAPAGTFVDTPGAEEPTPCAAGRYQELAESTECVDADAGTFISGEGSAVPGTDCPAGRYQDETGQTSCKVAPAGSFVATPAATEPTPCAVGSYQTSTESTSCVDADPGTFVPGTGSAVPGTVCPVGEYQDLAGQAACKPAPAGGFVDVEGSRVFTPCPVGYHQPTQGQSGCIPAPAGGFVDVEGAPDFTPCPVGRYQPALAQSSCLLSPPGHFVALPGSSDARPCIGGTYQPDPGAMTCRVVAIDFYSAGPGATEQTACDAGFTTNGTTGATACVAIVGPTITVPDDLTVRTDDSEGRVVEFAVSVTDDVDGAVVDCSAQSGDRFPIGDTVVSCQATDLSSTTSFASFTITVELVPRFATGVAPARLLETRSSSPTVDGEAQGLDRLPPGNQLRLQVAGRAGVDPDARAAIVNVTAIGPSSVGYITVHPCLDTAPTASSLNFSAGRTAGNEIIAELDDTGAICVFNSAETHLAIDVVGQVPQTSNYLPIGPARLTDTRSTGSTVDDIDVGGGPNPSGDTIVVPVVERASVSTDARAVVINVTAVRPDTSGYATVHPCLDDTPLSASLNFEAGTTRGNEIIAELDDEGRLCVFTKGATHITVDVVGEFAGVSDFQAVSPARLLDSRPDGTTVDGHQQATGAIRAGQTLRVEARFFGAPEAPDGLVANVTAIRPFAVGFLTVWNCVGDPPLASSLNFGTGDIVGNDLIIDLDDGEFCVYASATTHITIDAVGYQTIAG